MRTRVGRTTSKIVWWIRRDLRLRDNAALHEAQARGEIVIPLFIMDPALLRSGTHSDAERRKAFLFGGLRALNDDLVQRGSRLVVRGGEPARVLAEVLEESGAKAICAEADYSPYARRRDESVAGLHPLHLVHGAGIHAPGVVLKADGDPYTVFTPFRRAWKSIWKPMPCDLLPAPRMLRPPPALSSVGLPGVLPVDVFPPGEGEAILRLALFMRGPVFRYARERDMPGVAGTSLLSPYLRFGMLSVRQALLAARSAGSGGVEDNSSLEGTSAWINELIWRDFYVSILFHFPWVLKCAFRQDFRNIEWRHDPGALCAWQKGETGFPIVDAGMRQLLATGWMHNRVRMIVASFLVKDLLIDWREGERWFMRQLIDGDPAANNGGWQWAAGVGTDAAPYFRIFNPVLQSRKFDPDGAYVRRWVPELAAVPGRFIHEPWRMTAEMQRKAGCKIGKNYPRPIADHSKARTRFLKTFSSGAAK